MKFLEKVWKKNPLDSGEKVLIELIQKVDVSIW